MTIAMPDSITPTNIPLGYPAVLGYPDGDWPTAPRLPLLFPAARVVSLTVTGTTLAADGADSEKGDLGAAGAAAWVQRKLASAPGSRPVVYASTEGDPGYGMPWVLEALGAAGIPRARTRLLTAHYDWKPGGAADHICGPATCGAAFQADGTQWTSQFPGLHGSSIDMSTLADGFFGLPPDWTFYPVRSLKIIGAGPHSVKAAWDAPAGPAGAAAVDHYQLTVRYLGEDVGTPADLAKGGNPEVYQRDNLRPGTDYELFVRAVASNGHAGPWATVSFRTGPA